MNTTRAQPHDPPLGARLTPQARLRPSHGKGNPNSSISCRRNLCHGDLSNLLSDGLDTRDVAVLHVQVRFGVLLPADKAPISERESETFERNPTYRRLVVGLTGDLLLQHPARGSDETEERR